MFDQLIGILLLGLGINTAPVVNPNVKGDETVASTSAIRQHRKDFLESLKVRREEAKEKFASRGAQLKVKLAEMKDRKKAALIERIGEKCQNINEKRTDQMSKMLDKMSAILENVVNRAASASANGKDTSSVDTAITVAATAIADAQSSVAAQAGTQCVITINSETTAKNDVGAAIAGLAKELKDVYGKIVAAKKTVGDAVRALAGALGEQL